MMRTRSILVFISVLTISLGCSRKEPAENRPQSQQFRCFNIRYVATVNDIPENSGMLRLWVPVPRDNKYQKIADIQVESPYEYSLHKDSEYGNQFAYIEVPDPPSDVEVEVRFTAKRYENTVQSGYHTDRSLKERFLKGDALVPLSEGIRSMALNVVKGKKSTTDKARALYEHVLEQMTYDKSGEGWGSGDFHYACKAKKGNCSDFHSYFIGLCRNIGIPAYFEIGLSVPDRPFEGETGGYHCWAYFWDDTRWVPVDISEADKHPEKAEYFFGNLCENRLAFCMGRDIVLEPKQQGGPLNFLIYPYAEVDGRIHTNVHKKSFYGSTSDCVPCRSPE